MDKATRLAGYLATLIATLFLSVTASAEVSVPTIEDFTALQDRVAALEAVPPGSPAGMRLSYFDSGQASELVSSLPARRALTQVYRVNVGVLNEGDIVLCGAEMEATNGYQGNKHWGAQIIIGDHELVGQDYDWTTEQDFSEVTELNAFNVTNGMHHGVFAKTGGYTAPRRYDDAWVALVSLALSGMYRIEQDYGRLWCLKISR